ncbi:hypothetical protein AB0A63_39465 [Lentzea sp. NPDC042327]|uniref:hypothetical protein n=1 Tax=Lentzea sp. NPDC042327 TaxID=3154801 RepID=UPI0033F68759
MLRMSGEQMSYQVPIFNEPARSIALFEETRVDRQLEVLHGDWAQELLGCTVADYVGVALLFHTGALRNSGRLNLDWLDGVHFEPVVQELAASKVRSVARDHFVASRDEIKRRQPGHDPRRHRDAWRYQFNPLEARPVVTGLTADLLIPVPGLLVRKVSPLGVYHTGVGQWSDKFTRDVGWLFEAYVGRQLGLLKRS